MPLGSESSFVQSPCYLRCYHKKGHELLALAQPSRANACHPVLLPRDVESVRQGGE